MAATSLFGMLSMAVALEQGVRSWGDGQEHRFDGDSFTIYDENIEPFIVVSDEGTRFTAGTVTIENTSAAGVGPVLDLENWLRVRDGTS